jgi:hypothetical protein
MRYDVEFELHSDLGGDVGEAVRKAMSALGSIDRLKIVPVTTYTWSIQLNRLQVGADQKIW